jgi:hypothetical protein
VFQHRAAGRSECDGARARRVGRWQRRWRQHLGADPVAAPLRPTGMPQAGPPLDMGLLDEDELLQLERLTLIMSGQSPDQAERLRHGARREWCLLLSDRIDGLGDAEPD